MTSKIKELFPNWRPRQVAEFYGFPVDQHSGKGQTLGIISLGGRINLDELKSDFDGLEVPMPGIKTVDVMADSITDEQNQGGSGETHLDVEVAGSVAPGLEITIYRGPNPTGFEAALKKAIEDRQSVISISWGCSETTAAGMAEFEAVLKEAADKGITICASSGDWGSSNARNAKGIAGPAPDGKAHLEYPASSPWVLSCGGTELVSDNGDKKEVVWNNVERRSGAAGGGVSDAFALPDWQAAAGISIPSANTGKTGRVSPDVAGLAAGGDWQYFEDGVTHPTGGSSAVAPLWAGFIALVNEARSAAGKPRLGFFNDRLYTLAAANPGLFRDVASGTNRPSKDYPGYDAGPGFDACTGWGSPNGRALFEALVALD